MIYLSHGDGCSAGRIEAAAHFGFITHVGVFLVHDHFEKFGFRVDY